MLTRFCPQARRRETSLDNFDLGLVLEVRP